MCNGESVSKSFRSLSVLFFLAAFVLTLLNMIYSINNPKNFKAFKYIELTDYTKSINYSFLIGLNFGEDLMDSDDYGSIGTIQDICFLGTCIINDRKKTTYNCSLSCLKEIDKCFDGDNLCESKECDTYI